MRYTTRPPPFGNTGARFQVTPWVKILLIANAVVFLVTVAVGTGPVFDLFAFTPSRLLARPWGMLTYMFVHAGLWHLLMNLLFIYFFGPPLESKWGSDLFIKFYMVCGLGGVLLSFAFSDSRIVGASAACYGIMLAFALAWPNQPVYVWGLVPVRVKWLVGFLVAMSFVSAIGPNRDGVAHLAHLGGAVAGFLLLKSGWMPAFGGGRASGVGWMGTRGADPAGRRRRRGPRGTARKQKAGPASSRVVEVFERRRAEKQAAKERTELDMVDAVLDKISAQGIDSLTVEERDLLDRVSRQTKAN